MDDIIDREIWETIKNLKEDDLLSGYVFFPLLLRYPLSRVLGRSKRLELGSPEEKVFEYRSLIELLLKKSFSLKQKSKFSKKGLYSKALNKAKKIIRIDCSHNIPVNKIFVPVYSDRIEEICTELIRNEVLIIGQTESPVNFKHVIYPYRSKIKEYKVEKEKVLSVYGRLKKYLINRGYYLDAFSKMILFNSINNIYLDIQYVEEVYDQLSPKLILLFKDSYSPSQTFSLLSKKYGANVILLQHGQDCENYFLNDVYSDNVVVWGNYRRDRYEKDSEFKANISVLGNPKYEHIRRVPLRKTTVRRWLYVTRPHHSPFCYSYSRKVKEGVDILKIVANVSSKYGASLKVKPHHNDFISPYEDYIMQEKQPIQLTYENFEKSIKDVDLVISEDSSAIIDAMINGKLVILIHLAKSDPTLPISAFDAAPIVRNENELEDAIIKILSLDDDALIKLQAKQDKFIEYCAGPIGEQSIEPTINYIYNTMKGQRFK